MSDKEGWAAVLIIVGALLLGYNVGSMAKIASLNSGNQQVAAETQFRGER